MEIKSFDDFLTAIRGDQEQKQYYNGSKEFSEALFDLLQTSPETYRRYSAKLEREFRKQYKEVEG